MDEVGREGGEQCRWQENACGVDGTVKNNQICFMTIRRRKAELGYLAER